MRSFESLPPNAYVLSLVGDMVETSFYSKLVGTEREFTTDNVNCPFLYQQ